MRAGYPGRRARAKQSGRRGRSARGCGVRVRHNRMDGPPARCHPAAMVASSTSRGGRPGPWPMLRRSFHGAALACLGLATWAEAPALAASRGPAWQVYAMRYATVRGFPGHELVAGADTTRKLDIAMMFWLLSDPAGR